MNPFYKNLSLWIVITLMFVMLFASLVIVLRYHGGFATANQKILSLSPELFSRPGALGKYSPGIWLSFMMLWFFCDRLYRTPQGGISAFRRPGSQAYIDDLITILPHFG